MSYEIVMFLGLAVKFWMLAVTIGLPTGIIMAMLESISGEVVIYDHELEVVTDQVSVYEGETDVGDDCIFDIKIDEEKISGDIDKDIIEEEAIKIEYALELLLLAGFDSRTSGPAFQALMLLEIEELDDLWEATVLGKVQAA